MLKGEGSKKTMKAPKKSSEEILKKMGLSEQEINEAMDFKFQRGKYDPNFIEQDSSFNSLNIQNADQFYNSLSNFEYNDSILYPVGKVYGQDVFRSNELNFFNRAFDSQAPDNYLIGENDELTISIWGLAEHSETVVVNDKGYVNTQYAGRIYVGSKNFKKVKSLIKNRISNYFDLTKSQFDLSLNYSISADKLVLVAKTPNTNPDLYLLERSKVKPLSPAKYFPIQVCKKTSWGNSA